MKENDLVRENLVLMELKSIGVLARAHRKKVLTYLRLSKLKLGLLIKFGAELLKGNIERIVNNLEESKSMNSLCALRPWRGISPRHPIFSIALLGCVILFTSCASKGPAFRNQPDYSTAYLGPNGEIFFATPQGKKKPAEAAPAPEPAWSWNDDGVTGAPSIVIDLSDQVARFYKGTTEVGHAPVSTGREGYNTPSGNFSVIEKDADHISTLYGDYVNSSGEVVVKNVGVNKDKRPPGTRFRGAPMPHFLRVTGAVGMHAGYLPGYAASHGCIRLPHAAAEIFYENAPVGTPVRIVH